MPATALKLGDRLPSDFLETHRRQRILHALAVAINEHGYDSCSVAHVVRTAHVARNTFYDTFGGKDAAARALLADACPAVGERIDSDRLTRSGLGMLAIELAAQVESGDREGAIEQATRVREVLDDLPASIAPSAVRASDPLLCSLPAGKHGLPLEFVRDNQHHRLVTALAVGVVERGYQPTTIAEVCALARVSRRTFYEHFDGISTAGIALAASASETTALRLEEIDSDSGLAALIIEVVAAGVCRGTPAAAAVAEEAEGVLRLLQESFELAGQELTAAA